MTQSTKAECRARIRACLARDGFSFVTIAGLAGVHPNTLRDYESEDWNPKIDTLERIMRVVDGIDALARAA
jgi:transcriptional regulator with XRE-family HTH domain